MTSAAAKSCEGTNVGGTKVGAGWKANSAENEGENPTASKSIVTSKAKAIVKRFISLPI
jgi:hypothetical protein